MIAEWDDKKAAANAVAVPTMAPGRKRPWSMAVDEVLDTVEEPVGPRVVAAGTRGATGDKGRLGVAPSCVRRFHPVCRHV